MAVAFVAVPATSSGAAIISPRTQHCVVNLAADGTASPLRCYGTLSQAKADGASYSSTSGATSGTAVAALSGDVWEATHFDGLGLTGNSISVFGTAPCSGWLNLAGALASWNNKISSTLSQCTAWHFDGFNLTGGYESLTPPGGDLSTLDNRTSSIQYT